MLQIFILIFYAIFFFGSPLLASKDAQKEPFHPEWFAKDIKTTKMIKALINKGDFSESTIKKVAFFDRWDGNRDLGFGCKAKQYSFPAGYSSARLYRLSCNGKLISITIKQEKPEEWPKTTPKLLEVSHPQMKPVGAYLTYSFLDKSAEKQGLKLLQQKLGYANQYNIPLKLVDTAKRLNNPFAPFHIGDYCYLSGSKPTGREAMESLIEKREVTTIQALLRSLNPETRVYAALALMELERKGVEMDERDLAVIQIIKDLNIPLATCHGCIIMQFETKKVFQEWESANLFQERTYSTK